MRYILLLRMAISGILMSFLAHHINAQMIAPTFQNNTEYQFQYNTQISAGLIAQDEQSQADPQQKAVTRIQCLVKITFDSQQHAQLCLHQIRVGQLNEPVKDEQQCQPMSIFEPKPIPEDKQRQLELCCQFDYAEGIIERVQFQQEDPTWSKNIKRGVLNMIQLNSQKQVELSDIDEHPIPTTGEIYEANLNPRIGHEMWKSRPVLILQPAVLTDLIEEGTLLVAPLSSDLRPRPFELPLNIPLLRIRARDQLPKDSVICSHQLRAISPLRMTKGEGFLTQLTEEELKHVHGTIAKVLNIH